MEEMKEYNNQEITRVFDDEVQSCLRNERIVIRRVPKKLGSIKDPKHVLYGGMADAAVKIYTVPMLRSGMFVDVLTADEKKYLERAMNLEPNALSIYNKTNNFWSTANNAGVSKVILHKQDNYLDLSIPTDYIKYKILLANKDYIAPSLDALQDHPKATYEFVIISDSNKYKSLKDDMTTTMKCYKEYGKIEEDIDTLRFIVEVMEGRPTSASTKLEMLQTRINGLIQGNAKIFLKTITDPALPTKVMLKKAIDAGLVARRGDYLYLKQDNSPLCEEGQEPTFSIAAAYLNNPKRQELKFSLQERLK